MRFEIYLERGLSKDICISFKKTSGSGSSTRKGEPSLVDFV